MKQKPTNGVHNIDTQQMEQMRAAVVEQELSARSWKAFYEKMYYSMECEKLEPEYAEYKKRQAERIEKEKKAYEEFMAKMQEEMKKINEDNPNGELNIDAPEEVPVVNI